MQKPIYPSASKCANEQSYVTFPKAKKKVPGWGNMTKKIRVGR